MNKNIQLFCFTKNLYSRFPEYRDKYNKLEDKSNNNVEELNKNFMSELCKERIRAVTYGN